MKIAHFGMGERDASTELVRTEFMSLPHEFFSLGQDREYYERLRTLPDNLGTQVLSALQDVALDHTQFQKALEEPVMSTSLMRDLDSTIVSSQFRSIALGHAPRTDYKFIYSPPTHDQSPVSELEFSVKVDSVPPTNVHVLIGPNGVGKSTLMRNFASSLRADTESQSAGVFRSFQDGRGVQRRVPFDNLVTVAFSAFDSFPAGLNDPSGVSGDIPHHVVGLRSSTEAKDRDQELAAQFSTSLRPCLRSPRRERWLESLSTLTDADPILRAAHFEELMDAQQLGDEVEGARQRFDELSSGHKIALLTMTSLVRYLEERTLLLIDEPETHLHPPLLSALIQVVSRLAIERNSVAVLATHSPILLQEVPRSCVTVVHRDGDRRTATRPRIETFGESVSVLTSAVFGLNVTETGYHALLDRSLTHRVEDATLDALESQLGGEGRAILRALADDETEFDA